MKHDATIPFDLHVHARPDVKDDLGAFWSSVFKDQDLVDAILASKALSAGQLHITAMEDLSLRDHTGLPTYHREHWHPLFVRLSERNRRRGLTVGMEYAVIGEQNGYRINPDTGETEEIPLIYNDDEKFVVGRNDKRRFTVKSKVNTYPLVALNGCPLVRVRTCICDSIPAPKHILMQGRDFDIDRGVLLIRKEQDPFERDGYRVVEVETDRVAVLWVCDGEYDTNNIGDFLSYPMGFDVESTDASKRLLSAYWDAVIYGLAPRYLNTMLGALYDIPTAESDETVEEVRDDGVDKIVVTDQRVYRIATSRLSKAISDGTVTRLKAGDFLTDELRLYHSFSEDEFGKLVDDGAFTPKKAKETDPDPRPCMTLPAGSVLGVSAPVRVESLESPGSVLHTEEDGRKWFDLNEDDAITSPFWSAVCARATPLEIESLYNGFKDAGGEVDPLKTVGYSALANTVIVITDRPLVGVPYARQLFMALQALMPGYASLLTVQQAVDGREI